MRLFIGQFKNTFLNNQRLLLVSMYTILNSTNFLHVLQQSIFFTQSERMKECNTQSHMSSENIVTHRLVIKPVS